MGGVDDGRRDGAEAQVSLIHQDWSGCGRRRWLMESTSKPLRRDAAMLVIAFDEVDRAKSIFRLDAIWPPLSVIDHVDLISRVRV